MNLREHEIQWFPAASLTERIKIKFKVIHDHGLNVFIQTCFTEFLYKHRLKSVIQLTQQ